MDVLRGIKEATIDDYLIREGCLTQDMLNQISQGKRTLEVIKHQKNISSRAKEIINDIKLAREPDGYTFAGFATDFRQSTYQTTAIVLTKADGRSLHILYDSRLGVRLPNSELETELPLMMLNIPVFLWLNMGRVPPNSELRGDPVATADNYLKRFDERTQQEVVSIIVKPDRQLITPPEQRIYNQVFEGRKPKPVALT